MQINPLFAVLEKYLYIYLSFQVTNLFLVLLIDGQSRKSLLFNLNALKYKHLFIYLLIFPSITCTYHRP